MNLTILVIVGSVIVVGLAIYAGYLLVKLKKQQALVIRHQELAIEKRNANIFENVNTLCMVGIQGQCDLSEISIRVYCIMDYVQGEQRIDFEKQFPAISELYHIVKDMPRGEARQVMPKKERMQQNLERTKAEGRLGDDIIRELTTLKDMIQPLNQQIQIQMV
ncbi:DUF2489 domain-containing protein [Vibrio mangrovi]|uniref:DUF2489 domain-containing protein n=1 Tax=Vibrio mangrovi TaxID=474394 RepID=A0A1Y6IY06_9VIBR|nr:DUF2489 domain-containing protein [Vibrio mangrovi]MDW6002566.1 DUF2489 domain-containing protein [Vibrio mangrovi]SMS01901.1 hypothetical protein VIM7927_03210 [Vibrio mangrovi]